jgi:peptidoglycan hydrolase-like protein with peptidoglycan-binding domain
MRHADAKRIVDALGFSPEESLAVRLVGFHETDYGSGWGDDPARGAGSNNMGADTALRAGADTFEHEDSRYDPKTKQVVKYITHFQKYPTAEAGFRGLGNVLLFEGSDPKRPKRSNVRDALANRSILELATAMRANRYFIGTKPLGEAIADYARALENAYHAVRIETGETLFDVPLAQDSEESDQAWSSLASELSYLQRLSKSLPVLKRGNRGDLVGVLQFELGAEPDEIFGPKTDLAVAKFQEKIGLESDITADGKPLRLHGDDGRRVGVVGVKTWAALLGLRSDEHDPPA